MPTLDIRINSMYPPGQKGGIRAYASASIDGCFAVRGIKVVEGGKEKGLFVAMPSYKAADGYKEICCPITKEFREQLHKAVMDAYQQTITLTQNPPEPQPGQAAPKSGLQMGGM